MVLEKAKDSNDDKDTKDAAMGLDIVQLIMDVEEHFGVHVPDEAVARLQTCGDYLAYILESYQRQPPPPEFAGTAGVVDKEAVWRVLRQLIAEDLRVDESRVVPSAHLIHDLGAD